ncbi:helix-turn-helix domain-containing protein [Rummeliibacillus suwonensis]|uniref:helix-turn-helix domain-containing protein n=1 Tax=Rummeliibacillus suwonensis TaxID=1306154 RepID=UPI001FD0A40E|nr:helix-turn-helix domain-containing protein [Rummeliibacillus suwonensis]
MIETTLQNTLDELGITRNKLSVESKVRAATLQSLVDKKASSLKFDTLNALLDTINDLAKQKGIDKIYEINDIITYQYKKE